MLFPMGTPPAVGSARGISRFCAGFASSRTWKFTPAGCARSRLKLRHLRALQWVCQKQVFFFTTEGWRAIESTGRMRDRLFSVDFCYLEVVGALVSGKHFVPNVSIRHARGRASFCDMFFSLGPCSGPAQAVG